MDILKVLISVTLGAAPKSKYINGIACGTVRAYKLRKRKKRRSIKMIKVALEAFGYIAIGALVWIYSVMMLSI